MTDEERERTIKIANWLGIKLTPYIGNEAVIWGTRVGGKNWPWILFMNDAPLTLSAVITAVIMKALAQKEIQTTIKIIDSKTCYVILNRGNSSFHGEGIDILKALVNALFQVIKAEEK